MTSKKVGCTACETDWSIRGWFQDKKRGRLGQGLLNCLVRAHSNIIIENRLKDDTPVNLVPWDIECVIPDPHKPATDLTASASTSAACPSGGVETADLEEEMTAEFNEYDYGNPEEDLCAGLDHEDELVT